VQERHEFLSARYQIGERASMTPGVLPVRLSVAGHAGPEAALAWLGERLVRGLDLFRGRVWRAALAQVGGTDEAWFGIVVHHVAFDGWSEHVLADELSRAYADRLAGRGAGPDAMPPALSAARVNSMTGALRDAVDLPMQLAYWQDTLHDLPPVDSAPQTAAEHRPYLIEVSVTAAELEAIDQRARSVGTGRLAVLADAVGVAVGRLTRTDDLGIGVPVSRRAIGELEQVIGCLIDAVCVRVRPGPGSLAATARSVSGALAHSDVSMAETVQALARRPVHGRHPLYGVIAAVQDSPAPRLRLASCDSCFVRLPYPRLPVPRLVELYAGPGQSAVLRISTDARPDGDELLGVLRSELGVGQPTSVVPIPVP